MGDLMKMQFLNRMLAVGLAPLAALCIAGAVPAAAQSTTIGPAIWRIGSTPKLLPPVSMTTTPMVMPARSSRNFGVQPFFPPAASVVILPSYGYPYSYGGGLNYYPSVFGNYDGIPSYFYSPSVYVSFDPQGNLVFQELGDFYPYEFDPFTSNSQITVSVDGQFGGLGDVLDDFAADWANGNTSALSAFLPQTGYISLGVGNQYQYSVLAPAYLQLAGNTLSNLTTTDFRYSGFHVKHNGDAVASAVQTYRAHDGSVRKSNLSIVFSRDSSMLKGYRISGFSIANAN
jgi:hypothetical protein